MIIVTASKMRLLFFDQSNLPALQSWAMDKIKTILALLQKTAQEYGLDKGPMLAASLAYYAVFSLAPLLVLTVALASLFVGKQAIEGQLVAQIEGVVGTDTAVFIEGIIENASQSDSSISATIISTLLLLVGASSVFAQLKRAINTVWGISQPPSPGILVFIKTRLLAIVMVLAVGALLLISFAISTILSGSLGIQGVHPDRVVM